MWTLLVLGAIMAGLQRVVSANQLAKSKLLEAMSPSREPIALNITKHLTNRKQIPQYPSKQLSHKKQYYQIKYQGPVPGNPSHLPPDLWQVEHKQNQNPQPQFKQLQVSPLRRHDPFEKPYDNMELYRPQFHYVTPSLLVGPEGRILYNKPNIDDMDFTSSPDDEQKEQPIPFELIALIGFHTSGDTSTLKNCMDQFVSCSHVHKSDPLCAWNKNKTINRFENICEFYYAICRNKSENWTIEGNDKICEKLTIKPTTYNPTPTHRYIPPGLGPPPPGYSIFGDTLEPEPIFDSTPPSQNSTPPNLGPPPPGYLESGATITADTTTD